MSRYDTERFDGMFDDHYLTLIANGQVRSFYLHDEQRAGSCLFTFTPEGITIQGDWAPDIYGTASREAKPMSWFIGELSPDYLLSKFFRKALL